MARGMAGKTGIIEPIFSQLFERSKEMCAAVDTLNLESIRENILKKRSFSVSIRRHTLYQTCPRCKELGAFTSTKFLDLHLTDHRICAAIGTEKEWVAGREKKRKHNLNIALANARIAQALKSKLKKLP